MERKNRRRKEKIGEGKKKTYSGRGEKVVIIEVTGGKKKVRRKNVEKGKRLKEKKKRGRIELEKRIYIK